MQCAERFREHIRRVLAGDKIAVVHSKNLSAYKLVEEMI